MHCRKELEDVGCPKEPFTGQTPKPSICKGSIQFPIPSGNELKQLRKDFPVPVNRKLQKELQGFNRFHPDQYLLRQKYAMRNSSDGSIQRFHQQDLEGQWWLRGSSKKWKMEKRNTEMEGMMYSSKSTRCCAKIYVKIGVCEGCHCSDGLLKYELQTEQSECGAKQIPDLCKEWFTNTVTWAGIYYSLDRNSAMASAAKRCSHSKSLGFNETNPDLREGSGGRRGGGATTISKFEFSTGGANRAGNDEEELDEL